MAEVEREPPSGPGPSERQGTLAILLGALGDCLLALPALEVLAASAAPLTVWGPARERLLPLLAPRGPAAAVAAWPLEAIALWGEGPLRGPLASSLAEYLRIVAFAGPGPLARTLAPFEGVVVAAPEPGPALPAHACDLLLARLAAATGLAAPERGAPRLMASPEEAARGRALAGRERYVLCHPGSGGAAKRWAPAGFGQALLGLESLWVVGPAEAEDEVLVAALRGAARPCGASLLVAPPMTDLIALAAGAWAYLGNDSGPTHLAAALGRPTLALFGPTDPGSWGPRGPGPVRVLRDDLSRLEPARVRSELDRLLHGDRAP